MKNMWKNSLQLRNSASRFNRSRFSKNRLIISGTFVLSFAAFFTSQVLSDSPETSACACSANLAYDSMLPASHPQNRCALQAKELNWQSWLAGKSGSSQFHFFDLFELLHSKPGQNFNKPNTNDITPES